MHLSSQPPQQAESSRLSVRGDFQGHYITAKIQHCTAEGQHVHEDVLIPFTRVSLYYCLSLAVHGFTISSGTFIEDLYTSESHILDSSRKTMIITLLLLYYTVLCHHNSLKTIVPQA